MSLTKRIVIVGGGAGGLELATKLGRAWGRKRRAEIVLIDRVRTHLWKPLLHEIAAGLMDSAIDALSYRAHGAGNGYAFQLGEMVGLDRQEKMVLLGEIRDEDGERVLAPRTIPYDLLVIAVGSRSNDFGIPGVGAHCNFLDNPSQAQKFHSRLLNQLLQIGEHQRRNVHVAIVGGGATGVELSAELFNAVSLSKGYGDQNIDKHSLTVTLLEAGDKILPALPERISEAASEALTELGATVLTNTRVVEATSQGFHTSEGQQVNADLLVWAAGIKAADFLQQLDGLETNQLNQLIVKPTLQTTLDDAIYGLGDCVHCQQPNGSVVPPRAQSAHQMASHIMKNLHRKLAGEQQLPYVYKDYGSLVSLSKYSTVGSLMGSLMQGPMQVEGRLARIMYVSLYRMHQMVVFGFWKTVLISMVGRINRMLRPRLKLH